MFIRSGFPFNYDTDNVSFEDGLMCMDPTLAKQSFAEEVDINTIVHRFGLGGSLPDGVAMPSNADFDGVFDFQSAMNVVIAARESFDRMPARIRTRFNNDPALFVDFCSKDENLDEAIRMGLVPKPEAAPTPVVVPAVPGTAPSVPT